MEGTRFIDVPADRLRGLFEDIGSKVEKSGGHYAEGVVGREVFVDLYPPGTPYRVRVFTSLSKGAATVRSVGEDAVRIVVGAEVEGRGGKRFFKNLRDEGRRIYRTAPKGEHEERVNAFLGRLKDAVREAYKAAKDAPVCPACGGAMAVREVKATGSKFYGCLRFPECRGTARFE